MRNVAEVKTAADIREIFGLAAGGEAVAVERPGVVVLSRNDYKKLKNIEYDNKIEAATRRVQAGEGLVIKTMEELEAMEQ